METQAQITSSASRPEPWNKGKLIGQKPTLRPKHVWSIRTRLQMEGRTRDLAMFNLAIDSKLRGCDVVAIRGEDVAPIGYAVDRTTVRQRKTGRPVRFELTEQTRQAVDDYIKAAGKKPGEFLFSGRGDHNRCMTTRQYAQLISSWVATIGLDPRTFSERTLFDAQSRVAGILSSLFVLVNDGTVAYHSSKPKPSNLRTLKYGCLGRR